MGKRTLKILASDKDGEALQPILDALEKGGVKTLSNARSLKKKELLLAALSENFYADEELCGALLSQVASGAENIMLVRLDGSSIPDTLKTATYSRNVISSSGRDGSEIAARIIAAFPEKKSLWWLFVIAALIIAAASGVYIRNRRIEAEAAAAAAAEAARIEAERIAEEEALAALEARLPKGVTAADLEKIESIMIIGDSFTFQTGADFLDSGRWNDIYNNDIAYSGWFDDENHWISTEDGSEYEMTRYEELEFISLMPKLRFISMAMVDCDAMPDLSSQSLLERVCISDCNIDSLDWLSGSRLKSFDIHRTQVTDYSPLSSCASLDNVNIDLDGASVADLSGFAPPKLITLNVDNGQEVSVIDLSGLASCRNLRTVQLQDLNISDISFLEGLTDIRELRIEYSDTLRDISALASLDKLSDLTIRGCRSIRDYSPVGSCMNLQKLNLENNDWDNYSLTDASFLADLPKLAEIHLYGFPLNDFDFLEGVADNALMISLGFAGEIGDYSGLAAIKNYGHLHVNPRSSGGSHGDYSLVAPYLEGASVGNLQLYDCTNVDLSLLPKVTSRLEIFGTTLADLSGLQETTANELRLDSCQYLKSLDGIGGLKALKADSYSVRIEIVNCPRLTDYSALNGAKLKYLELAGQYELPDFSDISADTLRLESIYELSDLSCLDSFTDRRNHIFELVGLDDLTDLTPLRRFHGNRLAVPPQLAEQAQELVDSGNYRQFEIVFPDESWELDDSEIELLALEELDTLPKALLRRVGRLAVAGDMLIDWDQYDTDENWDNSDHNNGFPYLSLVDRETGEYIALNGGIVDGFGMFSDLTGLRELQLTAEPIESLDGVQMLENLRFLEARNCNTLRDISAAFALPELEYLKVRCSLAESIQGIQNLRHLKGLDIFHTQVDDLSPLAECDFSEAYANNNGFELECDQLLCTDFSALSTIEKFNRLCMNNMDCHLWADCLSGSEIRSFCSCGANWDHETLTAFVEAHPELEEFTIPWNDNVTDLSFLVGLENLRLVEVSNNMESAIESLNGLDYGFELRAQG